MSARTARLRGGRLGDGISHITIRHSATTAGSSATLIVSLLASSFGEATMT